MKRKIHLYLVYGTKLSIVDRLDIYDYNCDSDDVKQSILEITENIIRLGFSCG